jgi:hypothetical protein
MIQTLLIAAMAWGNLVQTEDETWQKVAPDGSGVEVQMPGDPQLSTRKIQPLKNHETELHLAKVSTRGGKALFMLGYHDLDFDPVGDDKIRDVLDGGVKGSVLIALGQVTKHERIKLGDYPGRQFEYIGKRFDQPIRATARIFLVGRRVYQISVISAPEIDVGLDAAKFLDSFQLVSEIAPEEPAEPFSTDETPPPAKPAGKTPAAGKK